MSEIGTMVIEFYVLAAMAFCALLAWVTIRLIRRTFAPVRVQSTEEDLEWAKRGLAVRRPPN